MTGKKQNKILDDKIEANVNQHKVDRLNAEISASSNGDLNKYEFLTRKDLKYKPNALDKTRFEFSPLGKTFSTGLHKTVQGYQEEGVIKLLKDIRDGLAGGIGTPVPRGLDRPDDRSDDGPDDRPDDKPDDRPDNRPDDRPDGDLGGVFLNNLNTNLNNIQNNGEYYARIIANQNSVIKKLEKELIDRKNLTKDIMDQTGETINKNNKEPLEYYDKYKNTLYDYIKALKQLNNDKNTYGREIGNLNNTINDERIRTNELRNKIQNLEDAEKEYLKTINELNDKLDELKNKKNISENDKEYY